MLSFFYVQIFLNIYASQRYILHTLEMVGSNNNHLDANNDGVYELGDILIFMQWLMMLIGACYNLITFFLYGPICRLVFAEMKENLFLHLEGN